MLKLLRWEWETKLKKVLMLWTPLVIVLFVISWVRQVYMPEAWSSTFKSISEMGRFDLEGIVYLFINTTSGRFTVLEIIARITSWAGVFVLGRVVLDIIWKEREIDGGYLLFTIPETASKILAAKFLASQPLLAIIVTVVVLFIFNLAAWWHVLLILYTLIMFRFLEVALRKTILLLARKWYQERLFILFVWAILATYWLATSDIEIFILTDHPLLFLIGVNTVLFFASAYLLEEKLDIWK